MATTRPDEEGEKFMLVSVRVLVVLIEELGWYRLDVRDQDDGKPRGELCGAVGESIKGNPAVYPP